MARCTPSGCSRASALGAASLAVLLLAGTPAAADWRWRQAAFPVAVFSGYTSHFGPRLGPWGGSEEHRGLDIAAPLGSPIRSWWGGLVKEVILDDSCGVGLVIRSGPYEHLYCHLAGSVEAGTYRSGSVQLQVGSPVRRGQLIAHVGVSGRSTGPHLHWGVRYGNTWVNPVLVLQAMAQARRR
ncbi:MAG: M23 family metallopeptidase [Vulcanococcus sp.]